MDNTASSTRQKALALNLDGKTYGTFAEIGAGQEVARWFFSVGGAAGTVAKTISAYDMAVSDSFYRPTRRYVSRERLAAMLKQEFRRLRRHRGATSLRKERERARLGRRPVSNAPARGAFRDYRPCSSVRVG